MNETWALLIDWIGNDYTHTIIDSAIDYCQRREISLVVATIGHLSFTLDCDAFDDYVLPVTANPRIDRILIASAQISSHGGKSVLENHFRAIESKPIVCVGGALGNYPVVKTRFQGAFRQLLEHLFVDHGYRRFAWVSGPADNPESRERDQTLRDFLREKGLAVDERLMLEGNFTYLSGKIAARALAALRGEWDVVVSANDTMAVALREVLGPSAPLTGFDDSLSARELGLTSVNPNLTDLVERALDVLSRTQCGENESRCTVVDSAGLVIRSSCGCAISDDGAPVYQPSDSSTERIGELAGHILSCQDIEELDRYFSSYLPTEGISFWKLLPTGNGRAMPSLLPPESADGSPFVAIVLALCFNAETYGYLLLDLKNRDFILSEWLRVHVSLLLQEWLRKHEGVKVQEMLSREIEILERRKADIETVVNSLPIWIMEIDRRLNLRYVNRAASALIGIPPHEVRNRPFLDLIGRADRDSVESELHRCRDQSTRVGCLFTLIKPDGSKVPVACEIETLGANDALNLSSLFGSLGFDGGFRLTGLKTRPLVETRPLDNSFFRDFAFSDRQREILEFLAKGLAVPEIARKMQLSDATVRVQIHNIYRKTGETNRHDLLELMNDYQIRSFLRPV